MWTLKTNYGWKFKIENLRARNYGWGRGGGGGGGEHFFLMVHLLFHKCTHIHVHTHSHAYIHAHVHTNTYTTYTSGHVMRMYPSVRLSEEREILLYCDLHGHSKEAEYLHLWL